MFYRYGFFSLSVRVVPRDDPGKWLIREPTADIFDSQSIVISETAGPDTFARQPFQVCVIYSSMVTTMEFHYYFHPWLKFFYTRG